MTKSLNRLFAALLMALVLGGCGQGTEVVSPPNPSIAGKHLLMLPEIGDQIYLATFSENTVLIRKKFQTGAVLPMHSQTVPYTIENGSAHFIAFFNNGTIIDEEVEVQVPLSILDTPLSPTKGSILINDISIQVIFFAIDPSDACEFTVSDTAAAKLIIQNLNVQPYSTEVIAALISGCATSTANFEQFSKGFLCALGINPALSSDLGIQSDIDNYDAVDDADFLDGDATQPGETCF